MNSTQYTQFQHSLNLGIHNLKCIVYVAVYYV